MSSLSGLIDSIKRFTMQCVLIKTAIIILSSAKLTRMPTNNTRVKVKLGQQEVLHVYGVITIQIKLNDHCYLTYLKT